MLCSAVLAEVARAPTIAAAVPPIAQSKTHAATGSDGEEAGGEHVTFLVRALECEDLSAGVARHVLDGVSEVRFERAERGHTRTLEDGVRVLVMRVPDRKLSARHACLRCVDGGWYLEDLGSTNGSTVWGTRVERAALQDGDLIGLGSTLFLFRSLVVNQRLAANKELLPTPGHEIETLCPVLEEANHRIAKVATSPLTVLLLGETGTGKELLAHALHRLSKRSGPLVIVNCGAIPAPLMEAQLFGHVRGAFTGAVRDEVGFVRAAHGGTLFLDEVADLPPGSQAALLRVLQNGDVTAVGSTKSVKAEIRVVAATHRDLFALTREGLFRQDLYARLAGFVQQLPPLRERSEDLGLLISRLLLRHAADGVPSLTLPAAHALFAHAYPLNIRELEHGLQSAVALAAGDPIALQHLPDALRQPRPPQRAEPARSPSGRATPLSAEDAAIRAALEQALSSSAGNVTETARRMGKARQQVQRWLRRFGLDPSSFRGPIG
jgi:DNA-binding NtrC family response regulator